MKDHYILNNPVILPIILFHFYNNLIINLIYQIKKK